MVAYDVGYVTTTVESRIDSPSARGTRVIERTELRVARRDSALSLNDT